MLTMPTMRKRIGLLALALALAGSGAAAQEVPVEEVVLDNGMTVLLVPRPGDPNVAAGWVAKVGSVYERPGITGVAHLFEHMMFKGTATIGTRNIEQDLQLIAQLDEVKADITVAEAVLLEAHRLGQIEDPDDPALRTTRHQELLDRFEALLAEQSELIIKEDFSRLLGAGRVRHERRHQLRLHDLFRERAGQQAGAVVLDGIGPPLESSVPRVLLRARGGARRAADADR